MDNQTKHFQQENLTEEIIKLTSSNLDDGGDKYTFMLVIASISWLLLTCLSVCIYCCNYWTLFEREEGTGVSRLQQQQQQHEELDSDEESSEQSELEQQQSRLLAQVN